MSYAEVTARNSDQSSEELTPPLRPSSRASPVPEIDLTKPVPVETLPDVDSAGVTVVPHDFPNQGVQTGTQTNRLDLEHEAEEREEEDTQGEDKGKGKAKEKAKKAARRAKRGIPNDPVELANGFLIAAILGFVGYKTYRKYTSQELSCKVAGIWCAGLAAFAVTDVVVTRFIQDYRAKSQE